MKSEINATEAEHAGFVGAEHGISCAGGTEIMMKIKDINPGGHVIIVSHAWNIHCRSNRPAASGICVYGPTHESPYGDGRAARNVFTRLTHTAPCSVRHQNIAQG